VNPEREPRPLSSTVWSSWVAGVGALVWFVTFAALLAGSQFYTDDLLYLQQGARDHLTLGWLQVNSYGHFAPVFRLIYAVVARLGGVNWALAAAVLATLVLLLYVALAWFTTQLLGRRPAAIVVAVAGVTCIPALRTTLWMASGVQVIGGALCMTFCIAGFVAYVRSQRVAALAISVLSLVVGLVWQERPILTIGYLVLIRYLFFPPDWALGRRRTIVRDALMWAPYLVVIAGYLAYRLFVFDASPAPGTLRSAWSLLASGVVRSYRPSLVGSRLDQNSGWFEPASILGALVLLGAFAALALTRRGVWRCVVFLLATYVANVAVQAAGRLGAHGADPIGYSRDLQYFVDPYLATIFALCLGAVLPRREPGALGRLVPGVAVLTAAVLAVVTTVSWTVVVRNNAQTGAHSYLNRAISELDATGPVDLVSLKVPASVAFSFVDPFTDQVQFLTIDKDLAQKIDPTSPRKVVLAADGSVMPVHPATLARSTDLGAARPVPGRKATLTRTAGGLCMSGGASSAIKVPLPAAAPLPGVGAFQFAYSSPHGAEIRVGTYTDSGRSMNQWWSTLPGGTDRTFLGRLDGEPGQGLLIVAVKPVQDLCIRSAWVGMLAVDTPDGCRVVDHVGAYTAEPADCSKGWPAQ
jgi:hypothetical protein